MDDIATSVLARLKNKSKESGRSYQLCLQLFCQEEFLRRLEKSKYVDNLVLKGGLFIYSLTKFDSRVTVDVDFLLRKIPNTPEQLRRVVEEIIAVETGNDFVIFEIKDVAPIAVTKKYAGIGVTMNAKIKNTRTPFSIDFGVGDVIVPKQEKRGIPTQLDDFEAPVINTYSIETTVAEKIDAILSLMEFSSRMKDYYDIYYLSHKFDFEGKVLCQALRETFSNRQHNFTIEQFGQIMTFDSDDGMQKKWKAFGKKIDVEMDDFPVILRSINEFLWEPYIAVMEERIFEKQWDANEGSWKKVEQLQQVLPAEIEKRSFEIITQELGAIELDPLQAPIIKRVIHTTADFDYVENLCFSYDAVNRFHRAIRDGVCIVTDTQMARAGINKKCLEKYGGEVYCFMSDEDVAAIARDNRTTRAVASMDKASKLQKKVIFAIGNAPTALVRLYELIKQGRISPEGIIGVPVGFVNVVAAKELIMQCDVPYIVAKGRKGGSNVAAAICNALLYGME